jgi:hypothetical protein
MIQPAKSSFRSQNSENLRNASAAEEELHAKILANLDGRGDGVAYY